MIFSIVVPIYNVQDYLEEALDSVLSQSFGGEFEVILVDDGSIDNSNSICKKYCKAHDNFILVEQKNRGLSGARNSGVKIASGDYLVFLDADDVLPSNALLNYENCFNSNRNVDIVIGKLSRKNFSNGMVVNDAFEYIYNSTIAGDEAIRYLFNDIPVPIWSACRSIFRREYFQSENYSFKEGITSEDLELIPKVILNASSVTFCNDVTYIYRVARESSITNTVSDKRFYDIISILNDYCLLIEDVEDKEVRKAFFTQIGNVVAWYVILLLKLNRNADISEIKDGLSKHLKFVKYSNNKHGRIISLPCKYIPSLVIGAIWKYRLLKKD